MIDFLNSFKSLVKLDTIHTDNNVFKLHYKFTVIMLIVFSILLTSKQYFGEPIDCDVADRKSTIETFCWIYGTYIIKSTLSDPVLPGLGTPLSEDDKIWQKYYQWVCVVFCFQALLFYLPRYFWKTWEGGRLRLLVKDLSGPLVTPTWNSITKDKLITYLMSGKYSHNIYAVRFAFCEMLNLLNVVGQIYLMDWFLTGHFTFYGVALATFNDVNPMNMVFPKLTKCDYRRFGPSGSETHHDALCVLPLNILNEKLFLILWFWLFVLSSITLVALLYRFVVLFVPKFRVYLLMAQTKSIGYKQANIIIKEITYGDFFLLYNVGKNVNPIIYRELIMGIHDFMKNRKNYKSFPENITDVEV